MSMRLLITFSSLIALATGLTSVTAGGRSSTWKETTDVSRGQLFAEHIAPKGEDGKPLDKDSSFSVAGSFSFPMNARFDGQVSRQNSLFGIDISHYTDKSLDFASLKRQNVSFVYIKATQGVGYRDRLFPYFWQRAGNLPAGSVILRGAYHFLSSDPHATALEQAQSFLKAIDEAGGLRKGDLAPVLDLEWDVACQTCADRWKGQSSDEIINRALTWLKIVQRETHHRPVLYTATQWWRDRGIPLSDVAKFSEFGLWIADYDKSRRATEVPSTPGHVPWGLWQFTANATLDDGYVANRGVDASIFKGSLEQFDATFGG